MSDITRRRALTGAFALAAAGAALHGRPAQAGTTHEVSIEGFAFQPAELTIAAGDSVRFTNTDGAPHDATADDGAFKTARLGTGNSDTITLTEPGVYEYRCSIHPRMRGVITVE